MSAGRGTVAQVLPASFDREMPLSSNIQAEEPLSVTVPGRSAGTGAVVDGPAGVGEGTGGVGGGSLGVGRGGGEGPAGLDEATGVVGGASLVVARGDADAPGAITTTRIAVAARMTTTASAAMDASPPGTERDRRAMGRTLGACEPASLTSCSK